MPTKRQQPINGTDEPAMSLDELARRMLAQAPKQRSEMTQKKAKAKRAKK